MVQDRAAVIEVQSFVIADSGKLVSIEECGVSFLRDLRIQGCIELYVNRSLVLGRGEIDTIDALWSLMLTYLENFMAGKNGVLNFPECWFTFGLQRLPRGNILVKFVDRDEQRVAVSPEKDLLVALASGAVEFFGAVLRTLPADEWSYRRDFNTALRLREECSKLG